MDVECSVLIHSIALKWPHPRRLHRIQPHLLHRPRRLAVTDKRPLLPPPGPRREHLHPPWRRWPFRQPARVIDVLRPPTVVAESHHPPRIRHIGDHQHLVARRRHGRIEREVGTCLVGAPGPPVRELLPPLRRRVADAEPPTTIAEEEEAIAMVAD